MSWEPLARSSLVPHWLIHTYYTTLHTLYLYVRVFKNGEGVKHKLL